MWSFSWGVWFVDWYVWVFRRLLISMIDGSVLRR
jgi:hypothetical protein